MGKDTNSQLLENWQISFMLNIYIRIKHTRATVKSQNVAFRTTLNIFPPLCCDCELQKVVQLEPSHVWHSFSITAVQWRSACFPSKKSAALKQTMALTDLHGIKSLLAGTATNPSAKTGLDHVEMPNSNKQLRRKIGLPRGKKGCTPQHHTNLFCWLLHSGHPKWRQLSSGGKS